MQVLAEPLTLANAEIEPVEANDNESISRAFIVRTPSRSFALRAATAEDAVAWLNALLRARVLAEDALMALTATTPEAKEARVRAESRVTPVDRVRAVMGSKPK